LAVATLAALTEIADVPFAVCQPDRPAGRGLQPRLPHVKVWAIQNGLEVLQPTKLKDGELARRIRDARIDLGVVLAYGRLLPQDLLDAPLLGCVNLHASLLPRHRGAAPIAWSIFSGDSETGVSLMQMDAGLDTGPVLTQYRLPIDARETTGTLTNRIAALCATVTRDEIPRVVNRELTPRAQNPQEATWAPPIRAADRPLDFNMSATALDARVRALSPAPAALTTCRGRSLRVLETLPVAENLGLQPGTVHVEANRRVLIATSNGALELVRGQFEGKKPLSAGELLNGRSITSGDQFGS
jgi:methionyl-tRNA formyltransferase